MAINNWKKKICIICLLLSKPFSIDFFITYQYIFLKVLILQKKKKSFKILLFNNFEKLIRMTDMVVPVL